MTDVQTNTPEVEDKELAYLRKQADTLGITYKSNTSLETLKAKVTEKLAEASEAESKAQAAESKAEAVYKEAMKLIRVIITPMDSNKAANMESDIFCAGNSAVGTVKRTIPFGVEWHVEQILLNAIKEKQYQAFSVIRNERGESVTKTRMIPAYNVTILEPLTEEELKALADQQLRSRSLEDE